MKVIRVSNYDDEGPAGDQRLIMDNLSLFDAESLAARLNADPGRSHHDWYRAVDDDYTLQVFEP